MGTETPASEVHRVLLLLEPGGLNPQAAEWALRLARLHRAEMVGLLLEDTALMQVASLPFATEIRLQGAVELAFDAVSLTRQMGLLAQRLQGELAERARRSGVASSFRRLPGGGIASALAERQASDLLVLSRQGHGPWSGELGWPLVTVLQGESSEEHRLESILAALEETGGAAGRRRYAEILRQSIASLATPQQQQRLRQRRPSLLLAPAHEASMQADPKRLLAQLLKLTECTIILY